MFATGYLKNAFDAQRMMTEAQSVVAYRMLGMAGLWPVQPSEMWRMTFEKAPAFAAASQAATVAAFAGKSPDAVAAAWLKPIGGSTSANQKRLSRG